MTELIYEPKGMAREYAPLALNLYTGCSHGCTYCYAPGVLHKVRSAFHSCVQPRVNVINLLKKELEDFEDTGRTILLSFTSDPYQSIERTMQATRRALEMFDKKGIQHVAVLTKAAELVARDFDLFEKNKGWYIGVTITGLSTNYTKRYEPNAPNAIERFKLVHQACEKRIPCFVSIEPVIDAKEAIWILRQASKYPVNIRIGKENHGKNETDWGAFLKEVLIEIEIIKSNGSKATFYIKDGFADYGDVPSEYRIRQFN